LLAAIIEPQAQNPLTLTLRQVVKWKHNQDRENEGKNRHRIMELMSMHEKYYTPEQMEEIKARGQQIGEERIRQVEAEWPQLIAQVRAEMDKGTDPTSEKVLELARRWRALVEEFTGGNPGIEQSLGKMWQNEPELGKQSGIDKAMFEYIGKAMAALDKGKQE
jgi:hypothetical protein